MSVNPKFRLLPKSDLQEASGGFDWQSTGEDPAFKLKPMAYQPKGWYMLEVQVESSATRLNSKLYVDYGEGINEANAILLPLTNGKPLKRVCYFSQRPLAIHFDPSEQPCSFSVKQLKMTRLTSAYARKLMIKKLTTRHTTDSHSGLAVTELLERYNHCFSPCKATLTYPQWQQRHEPAVFDKRKITNELEQLNRKPLISIVMATYNTEPLFLKACIDSVLEQSYCHWELCIADDCSTDEQVRTLLNEYSEKDTRIKVTFRSVNGHISKASNTALELATGDYVGLLDHDDCLAEHALFYIAKTINERPQVRLLYSDEDKIDEKGVRYEPHFKTDWNRDLFYSHNYITHFSVFDATLIKEVGGFRSGLEGSQDYDLILRCVAKIGNDQIAHIPHILYHWRAIKGSTALSSGEKNYTTEAGYKALQDFFKATYIPVEVRKGQLANTYRTIWPMPKPLPFVSLLIPTRDGYEILKQCIESIRTKTTYPNYEIVVLNNQTTCDKTLDYFERISSYNNIRVLNYDFPFNYSAINNFGVPQTKGSIIGLINNDIEVISPDWLDEMVRQVSRPDIGCVGAKLYYPDNRIQHAGVTLGIGGVAGHTHKYFSDVNPGYFSRLKLVQNFSAVTAAAMLVRKSVFEEVEGFEEKHLKVAFNDVDFCLKVRDKGYRNIWTPHACLYHHESLSRGAEDNPEKQARFQNEIEYMKQKWGDKLTTDPYYSPNLTLNHEDFSYNV
ncbi:glycosyltransferase [Endozoicomonas sp. ONNA1]|uniref:glycosyltransferase family 2 protein n=1 Tax=Endozoicomonas sp. ONNA1 TaxID=2828740 RepID=UPI002147E2A4|nr:glycosyltransferase [Endozoicomonas sp. ONNA1]